MGIVKYTRVAVKSCRLISSANTLRETSIDRPGNKRMLNRQAVLLKKINKLHS